MSPFIAKLRQALDEGTLVKLTLSQPAGGEPELRNLYVRVLQLKEGPHLSFLYRYATRDITKNLPFDQALPRIEELLTSQFERAHLFTTTGDWQLHRHRSGQIRLKASRPAFSIAPEPEHDRRKAHALSASAPYLRSLGITNAQGETRPGMADKLRQIQRFVELLGHLIDECPGLDPKQLHLLDMGAGKGSLTFAAYEFLKQRGFEVQATGVELRPDLVKLTNAIAAEIGFSGLRFVTGSIGEFPDQPRVDLLIALHACNTATDDSLAYGIRAGAALIVTAPCCHKEVRLLISPPALLEPIFKHGILAERQAELLTDAIRALLLEIHGYKTSVFEFISSEHTGKNLMIAASKRAQPLDPAPFREKLRQLCDFYGLKHQHLAAQLGELPTL